jgi:hypothetical protein
MEKQELDLEQYATMSDRQLEEYYGDWPLASLAEEYSMHHTPVQREDEKKSIEGYEESASAEYQIQNLREEANNHKIITLRDMQVMDEYYSAVRHGRAIAKAIWNRIDAIGINSNIYLEFAEEERIVIMPSDRKIYVPSTKEEDLLYWTYEDLKKRREAKKEWDDKFDEWYDQNKL